MEEFEAYCVECGTGIAFAEDDAYQCQCEDTVRCQNCHSKHTYDPDEMDEEYLCADCVQTIPEIYDYHIDADTLAVEEAECTTDHERQTFAIYRELCELNDAAAIKLRQFTSTCYRVKPKLGEGLTYCNKFGDRHGPAVFPCRDDTLYDIAVTYMKRAEKIKTVH